MELTESEVIYKFEKLAHAVAHRFAGMHDHEDLCQSARLGILIAYRTYNPQRGASFATHAYNMAEKQVRDMMRKDRGVIYIPAHADQDPDKYPIPKRSELEDLINEPGNDIDSYRSTVTKAVILQAMEKLPLKQRQIVLLHAFERMTLTDAAVKIGCTRQHASVLWCTATSRLCAILQGSGLTFESFMHR